jgi:hypothetical protein
LPQTNPCGTAHFCGATLAWKPLLFPATGGFVSMNDDRFSIQLLSENEILPVPRPAECHVSDFVSNAILLASSTCKSQMQVATAKFHSAGPLARRTAHFAAYCNFIVGSVINRGFQSRKTFGLPAQID